MEQAEIASRLKERFGDRILVHTDQFDQHAVTIGPNDLLEMAAFLRDEPDLAMNFLTDVSGVDYLGYSVQDAHAMGEMPVVVPEREWRYEIAYQFFSLDLQHAFRLRVAVTDDTVKVPTMATMWRTANWLEREIYDQYGIHFQGHKNLRRILNHDEFVGHPLRKDYPIDKRQTLSRPTEMLLPDDPEWA